MLYRSPTNLDVDLGALPSHPRPNHVLLTSPEHFDVQYVINPHMAGKSGTVHVAEAATQWRALREAYRSLSLPVDVLPGAKNHPDMVFCANQTLPFYRPSDGERGVVLSRMKAAPRQGEVKHYERFFRRRGRTVVRLPERVEGTFEGMGDAIWHPRRHLLWGGCGPRTTPTAYEYLSDALDAPVILLTLSDDDFYHLDTCFSVLDEHSVLIYPGALDADSLALIRSVFDQVLEAPEAEARHNFACNAHCPDEEHVLIQRGCDDTMRQLRKAGFTPIELDTGEFLKAGGSVFCMKLMFW